MNDYSKCLFNHNEGLAQLIIIPVFLQEEMFIVVEYIEYYIGRINKKSRNQTSLNFQILIII